MVKKVEAVEIWFWRKMMRISWTDKLTNEVILEKVRVERQLLTTIRRQWRYIRDELRRGGIERNIL